MSRFWVSSNKFPLVSYTFSLILAALSLNSNYFTFNVLGYTIEYLKSESINFN
jgi:hypothetical protein